MDSSGLEYEQDGSLYELGNEPSIPIKCMIFSRWDVQQNHKMSVVTIANIRALSPG
jgi:hypothetical protein